MLKQTKYLGETKIEEDKIIQFPYGLPGFQDERSFALLDLPGNNFFNILQSLTTPKLAFIVTNPYEFNKEYSFDLDDGIIEQLQIEQPTDIIILTIVTVKEPFANSTLNLKAPIIVHAMNKRAKQYILNNDSFKAQTPLTSNVVNHTSKGE